MPTLRSSRVVLPDGERPATVHHEDGVITKISDSAADVDYGSLVVLPGLVDSHVHVNEPGRTEWEGFETATRAAAAGGTTTIVDMPLNSIPPTISPAALEEKRGVAAGKLSVDVGFWGGLVPGSEQHVTALVAEGVSGFKSFLVDSGVPEFPPMSPDELGRVLPVLTELGVPLLLHAEDPLTLLDPSGNPTSYASYLVSRPPQSESAAIRTAESLSVDSGAKVHILHVSSEDAAAAVASASGLSGETCPHYLTFCAEDVPDGATAYKCAPPIRSRSHREALWEALRDGVLSMVVSDHSPAPADLKETESGDFLSAWGGVGSLQLRLQATWTGAHERGFVMSDLARWLSSAPASLAGLDDRKGSIEVGMDADFVVFDPDGRTVARGSDLHHRHPLNPYEGMSLRGSVEVTVLRGQTVCEAGLLQSGMGRMLERK